MFKIISVGWQCADWIEQTLRSVEVQTRDDWEIGIVYDPSPDDGWERIVRWTDSTPNRSYSICRGSQEFAVRNQYEVIKMMSVQDDDIIVFLDLDGDQLAHPNVLQRLADYYADDTLLTYGSYRPVPDPGTTYPARAFPNFVIKENSYRHFLRTGGGCCFNHLRTMKGKVFNAIPESAFKWPDGSWYEAGTDYVFMVNGLELAAGRHKFIDETLLLYNHAQPNPDYLYHPMVANACTVDMLHRPPLSPL